MTEALNAYFRRLDAAPIGNEAVFPTDAEKERHESLLTFASRKRNAASYHLGNVRKLLERDSRLLEKARGRSIPSSSITVSISKITLSITSDEYVYELSAFLETLKSSLDLIAEASSSYLKGIQVNFSISPLMKLSNAGARGPIMDQISKHNDWLCGIRDYRHYLVHRLMPSIRTGFTIRSLQGITSDAEIPVVVPQHTPLYERDTRRSRMEDVILGEGPLSTPGISVFEETAKTKVGSGAEQAERYSVGIVPAEGYCKIDEFMDRNAKAFDEFAADIIEALIQIDFREVFVTKPKQGPKRTNSDPT